VIKTWEMATATKDAAKVSERTLDELKSNRDQETAPYVIIYIDIPKSDKLMYLVIKNIGKSIAKNVKFQFSPQLTSSKELFENSSFLNEGIASMPPGYELKTFFDISHNYFENELPFIYDVKIEYQGGISNKKRVSEQKIDLMAFYDLLYVSEKNMDHLVGELEKISDSHKKTSDNIYEIRKIIKHGIWLKNSQESNIFKSQENNWLDDSIFKLNEFLIFYSVYKNEEFKIDPFLSDIKNRFNSLGAEILIISSNSTIPEEINENLMDIGIKIFKLGRFIESLGNKTSFEEFAEDIAVLVKDCIIKIESFSKK
jgi:hypothetical protein